MARRVAGLSLAFALGGVLLSGCEENTDSVPDERRSVSGVVSDGVSGKELKGVAITFTSDTLDEADDKTNADGEYDLTVSTDSKHGRIEATKSGYETRVVSVFFDDDAVEIDIELTPK